MSTRLKIERLVEEIFPGLGVEPPFDDMTDLQEWLYLQKLEAIIRPFWTWPLWEQELFFERYPYLRPKNNSQKAKK